MTGIVRWLCKHRLIKHPRYFVYVGRGTEQKVYRLCEICTGTREREDAP